MLAKLACGLHKPNKQTVLPHSCVDTIFSTLPLRKVSVLTWVSDFWSSGPIVLASGSLLILFNCTNCNDDFCVICFCEFFFSARWECIVSINGINKLLRTLYCCRVPQLNTLGDIQYMQLFVDKCTAYGERTAGVSVFEFYDPATRTCWSGGLISICRGWILLCKLFFGFEMNKCFSKVIIIRAMRKCCPGVLLGCFSPLPDATWVMCCWVGFPTARHSLGNMLLHWFSHCQMQPG